MTDQKRTFSWMNPKLVVREAGKCGKGVFAKEEIKKDERLAIFGGYVLTLKEESQLLEKFQDTGVQIAENFVLTTRGQKEDTDCFNHSCEPNAGFNGQIFLVAMRDITVGEQIVIDYAMVLFGDGYRLQCLCEAQKCRGYVTAADWKRPELQNKYDGYFQYFLQEKINKLKEK